jgi:hypothetical protein
LRAEIFIAASAALATAHTEIPEILAFPRLLSQLAAIDPDESTDEAIGD